MPGECEGIQGFPAGWTLPSNPPDDPEKLDTLRYTALGNAVTVPVIEWLARRILPVLERMKADEKEARGAMRLVDPSGSYAVSSLSR